MSPIIDLQRRMVEAGRIRAGEKGSKGEPRKLSRWRLTSKDKVRLEEAAKQWGGEVKAWSEREGEWELYTETDALPIMLLPGQLPTTWYELWSKGGCQRRCDGQHEIISDSSCLCGEERECKPTTRMSVLLPDLPGIGSWLLSSTGWNAAAELAGAADLLQRASAQGVLIPARLRLEQRVSVSGGETRKFAVPVIDIDVSFRDLLGASGLPSAERPALPSGYVPLTGNGGQGVSLEQGLAAAEQQAPQRTARSAAPIPEGDEHEFGEAVPVDELSEEGKVAADAKALNALVGSMREAGEITTRNLYTAVAQMRGLKPDEETGTSATDLLIALLGGEDEAGELHWSPLRDDLTPEETAALRKRLGRKWAEAQAAVTA